MYKIEYSNKALRDLEMLKRSGQWKKLKSTIDDIESILRERGCLPGRCYMNHDLNKSKVYGPKTFDCHLNDKLAYIYKTIGDTVNIFCIGTHSHCQVGHVNEFTVKAASRLAIA